MGRLSFEKPSAAAPKGYGLTTISLVGPNL